MRLFPIFCLGLAHAGSYGSVRHAFAGYSTNIDCSVGHSTNPAAETSAFESCKQRAEAELTRRDPELAAAYRLFVAHTRLASRLDGAARQAEWEHAVSIELPRVDDGLTPTKNPTLQLFVKAALSPALRAKLSAEFARTQILDGGVLRLPRPDLDHDLSQTQHVLVGLGRYDMPLYLLQLAFQRRDEVAQLAHLTQPLPKKFTWAGDQRPALVVARVIDAVLHDRPFADDTFTLAAQLDAGERGDLARLMAVFSNDPRVGKLSDDPLVAELLKL